VKTGLTLRFPGNMKTLSAMDQRVLSRTESLCPVCLEKIPAARVARGQEVYLEKVCPRHGPFRTVIWRGEPPLEVWARPKIPTVPPVCFEEIRKGCPFDCGLCPSHRQVTCTALIEVTSQCNLRCPYCFASAGDEPLIPDPDLAAIRLQYERVKEASGSCNVQISGGEPTLREDLPAVIEAGSRLGFEFIQLNTNGLRLGTEKDYALRLKDAGLSSAFLQFDGVRDDVYVRLRGRPLLARKEAAIERCAEAGIGVVLVPTVVPGVNEDELGAVLDFALTKAPAVRGIHFQPVSYFGRHPADPGDEARITLPEIMSALERQSGGRVKTRDFRPPGCENAWCSFHGNFLLMSGGRLKALTGGDDGCCGRPERAEEGARRAVSAVGRQWRLPQLTQEGERPGPFRIAGDAGPIPLNDFLSYARNCLFSVSGMAFQDVWTLDLDRLRDCCIHTVASDGRLIPFCAYNLTNMGGKGLYRGRS
jgi:uncharacterized radical SAM superfamily Fe-S cluster-containing enzyme